MSSNKKNILRTIFKSNAGCGCSRTKPSDVFEPTPKPKNENPKPKIVINENTIRPCISSSSSYDRNGGLSLDEEDLTSTTISEAETDPNTSQIPSKIFSSIAVEKDSDDPYQDFRHSMLQMIIKKEIYSKDDLQELLNCFLQLNSPCHHDVIIKAFKEIWDEVVSHRLILQKPSDEGQHTSIS
uniref:Transcription repressor n=1 Tax=Fagus sylvatica TaxID=28930 RepID=A0A2N9INS7_FAGSY